ncbi:MAG: DUF349 domain-containing protein [Ectothiorhodospiraceae bacterium]|nr:DUF349 domain-containing protein [Ectothiorhodospiraceae bacterium]
MILKRILKRRKDAGGNPSSAKRPGAPRSPLAELDALLAGAERDDQRLRELLAAGAEGLPLERRLAAISASSDSVLMAYLARNGREMDIRLAAVERAVGERLLEEVAVHDRIARVRQRAVGRLESRDSLERVWRECRGKDARVARDARHRLDTLERAEAEAAAARTAHEQLCVEAEALAEEALDKLEAAVNRLRNRWQGLPAEAPGQARLRFARALEAALERRQNLHELEQPWRSELEALQTLRASIVHPDADTVERVRHQLDNAPALPEDQAVATALRTDVQAARQELAYWAEDMLAWFAHQGSVAAMLEALDDPKEQANPSHARHLAEQLQQLPWRPRLPEPALLQQARARGGSDQVQAPEPRREPRRDDDARLHPIRQAVQAMLPEVEHALQDGDLRRARRLLNRLRHKAEGLPGRERHEVEERLRPLSARVQELQDWRRFAVLPKQEALCERMDQLGAEPLSPEEQLEAIQGLRREWKELGGSDSKETRALWERFQQAADAAFEHCREWIESQRQERQRHLQERERICRQLEEFLSNSDLESMALPDLERIHATAKQEWRQASPVDPQASRAVKRRFRKAMDRLGAALGGHRHDVRDAKKRLLDEARSLAQQENAAAAAGRARELQAQWRELPPLPAGEEHRRHRELRAACDQVFQALRKQHAAVDERRQEEVDQAEALCRRMEQAAAEMTDPQELESLRGQLRRDFSAYPGAVRKALQKSFSAAESALNGALMRQQERIWMERIEILQQAAREVRLLEVAVQQGGRPEQEATDPGWLNAAFEALAPLHARWQRASDLLHQGGAFSQEELQQAGEQRRRLCVQLELLAGAESPPQDRDLRMQLQVERLSASLRHQADSVDDDQYLHELARRWYELGPWPQDAAEDWEERFAQQLKKRVGG